MKIDTALIQSSGRIREADARRVAALAESIKVVGLLNPITAYRRTIIRAGQDIEGFGLIAGMHRLRACQSLGWTEIEATVVDLDDDERIIAECDENLCVAELSATDRAKFTRERKAAYLRKYPETGHGGDRSGDQDAKSASCSFAADQSNKTGQSKRAVQLDAERGEKVTDEALDLISGTKLDTGVYLDKIKSIPDADQVKRVRADLADLKRPPQNQISIARSKIDSDIRVRAARYIAEILAEHSDDCDGIKANLAASTTKDILAELTNITGNSLRAAE